MSEAVSAPHARRLSVAKLALVVPWVALVIGSWGPIRDNSFLWHVRAGTLQAASGSVLTTDPFSFTLGGAPWLTQSWLAELGYGRAESAVGLDFVPFMILIIGGLTMIGLGTVAYRSSRSVTATLFVLILSVILLTSFLVPRPVLFSYLLMTLVVLAWSRRETRWLVPFVMWIWAAVHASFLIGLAYVGLTVIAKRQWRELPKAVAAGVGTFATAHGIGVVSFLLTFSRNRDSLQYLSEWRSPQLLEPLFLPFVGGLIFIFIGFLRKRLNLVDLVVIIPFAILGFTSVRAVPPAWIALAPFVAQSLGDIELGTRGRLRPRLAIVFGLVVVALPFLLTSPAVLSEDKFPIEASKALSGDRVFHDDSVGGYLIWAEGPERQVYIDDRAELYGDRMGEFVEVRAGRLDWEPVFEHDRIDQVLLETGEPLLSDLVDAGWETVYSDEDFTVLSP